MPCYKVNAVVYSEFTEKSAYIDQILDIVGKRYSIKPVYSLTERTLLAELSVDSDYIDYGHTDGPSVSILLGNSLEEAKTNYPEYFV